jgi:hypothetical protein
LLPLPERQKDLNPTSPSASVPVPASVCAFGFNHAMDRTAWDKALRSTHANRKPWGDKKNHTKQKTKSCKPQI